MASRSLFDLIPQTSTKAVAFLAKCKALGFPLLVTSTYRSFTEQAALFAKGRTAPGRKVTNARPGQSFHNVRRAFDVVFTGPDGAIDWEGDWKAIGAIGVECGLSWGGDFVTFLDRPHFEDRWCNRCKAEHAKAMSFDEHGNCSIREE